MAEGRQALGQRWPDVASNGILKKCRTCDENALVSGDVAEVSEGVAGEAAYARRSLLLPAAAGLPLPQQQPVRDLPEPGQMGRIMIIPTEAHTRTSCNNTYGSKLTSPCLSTLLPVDIQYLRYLYIITSFK